ncbi:MAG TPA: hypothetical protein VMS77_00065 [Conexivisphaerales archaeon]|nr:hypothetical protein [Conexivisphaerales archaeon]
MVGFSVLQIDVTSLVSNLWILIFFMMLLVPSIQKWLLNSARQELLVKISRKLKSEVITLIHRQETIAFLGIPLSRYIDIEDSEDVLRAIRLAPQDSPIVMILHTPGGIALAATQIALALSSHTAKKTVMVPHYAMSGGTLIALAADEIVMDPYAVLGPVDPQFTEGQDSFPAVSVVKVLEKKDINKVDDRTIILADEAKKAVDQMEVMVRRIMANRYPEQTIQNVVDNLVVGKYTHDYPLTSGDAAALGLRVTTGVPTEVYRLMELYKMETGAKRPGVDYVPVIPSGPREQPKAKP